MNKIIEYLDNIEDIKEWADLYREIHSYVMNHKNKDKNLLVGAPTEGNELLLYKSIKEKYKFMAWNEYFNTFSAKEKDLIFSCIAVLDLKNDGSGGRAEIISGGIGSNSVRIKLKSGFQKGMEYLVIIFGGIEESKKMDTIFEMLNNIVNKDSKEFGDLYREIHRYVMNHKNQDKNLLVGAPTEGNELLCYQTIKHKYITSWSEYIIELPRNHTLKEKDIISCVAVLDLKNEFWSGGRAEIISGGVGTNRVRIKLESGFQKVMKYLFIIFGSDEDNETPKLPAIESAVEYDLTVSGIQVHNQSNKIIEMLENGVEFGELYREIHRYVMNHKK